MTLAIICTVILAIIYVSRKVAKTIPHKPRVPQEPEDTILWIRHLIRQAGSIEELKAIRQEIIWLEEKHPETKKICEKLSIELLRALHNNKMAEDITEQENRRACEYMEKQVSHWNELPTNKN